MLSGSRAESIAGPGTSWTRLATLPSNTATLALGPAGQVEALADHSSELAAWQLGTGAGVTPGTVSTSSGPWHQIEKTKVDTSSGSSG